MQVVHMNHDEGAWIFLVMGAHWKTQSKGMTGSDLCFKRSTVGSNEPKSEEDLGGLKVWPERSRANGMGPSGCQDPIICLWLWSMF